MNEEQESNGNFLLELMFSYCYTFSKPLYVAEPVYCSNVLHRFII